MFAISPYSLLSFIVTPLKWSQGRRRSTGSFEVLPSIEQRHVGQTSSQETSKVSTLALRLIQLFTKTTATPAATQRHDCFLLASSPFVEWSLCCCCSRNSGRWSHRSPHRAAQKSPLLLFHCYLISLGTKDVDGLPPPPPHCCWRAVSSTLVFLWPVCVRLCVCVSLCVSLESHGKVLDLIDTDVEPPSSCLPDSAAALPGPQPGA